MHHARRPRDDAQPHRWLPSREPMTFPLVCYCNAVPRPVLALIRFVHAAGLAFVLILCFLGLYEFPYTAEDHAPLLNGSRRRAPAADGPPPDEVKRRLGPPVEFARLAAELSANGDGEAATCRVCLERLEPAEKVRRLGNCAHAFHHGCIDRWIDLGELTCPLCRAHLLPRQRGGLLARARFG